MTQNLQMWNVPNRVLFGNGAAKETGSYLEEFDVERPLVITDENVRSAGVLDPVLDSIEAVVGDYAVFDGVVPDPTDAVVHDAADAFDATDADGLVGVGGGSSIDTAKAASIVASNGGHILEYEGSGNVAKDPPPTIYMPTTSGSGSEVGNWCIVRDSGTDIKEEIGDVGLLADLAVIDPSLTASAPAPVKAHTGLDVLAHAVEAFVSINAQSQTSALAIDSIEKVGRFLPRAVEYRDGDDEALSKMARASSQAGMAFNGAGLGAVHAISHQIGGQFGVSHGLVNAILLPYVMEYNLQLVPDEMVTIAEALGENVDSDAPARREGYKAVRAARKLADSVRIPETLAETDVDPASFPELAADAMDDGSLTGNPRATHQTDIEGILQRAYEGEFLYESELGT
jgi:alcohol dehydrogenase